MEWIEQHPILIAIILYFAGGASVLPFIKFLADKTPTKVDDGIVQALETVCKNRDKIIIPELEKRLSTAQIQEIIRLRKARYAMENKTKR